MPDIAVTITSGAITVVNLNRGFSGFSGRSGYSGFSGNNPGTSGYSGLSGFSGFSGRSGYSGFSGSGYSGFSGRSGYSGYSGIGTSGFSGFSGTSGYSGFSGVNGISILATTSLNVNTNTKQTLYTVPGGKSAIVIAVVLRGPSVDLGAGATTAIAFGFNAGANDWALGFAPGPLDGITKFLVLDQFNATSGNSSVIGTAGQVFGAKCDVAYGSAATVTVDVIGYTF